MERKIVFTDDNYNELRMFAEKTALTIEVGESEFAVSKREDVNLLIEELQYLQEQLEK